MTLMTPVMVIAMMIAGYVSTQMVIIHPIHLPRQICGIIVEVIVGLQAIVKVVVVVSV
jgi:hypothetical protein